MQDVLVIRPRRPPPQWNFRSPSTPRDADQAAFALDVLALLDALGIRRAVLAGYDWGSRIAGINAALWPERVGALVSVTGYGLTGGESSDCTGTRYEFGESSWKFNSRPSPAQRDRGGP